MRKLFSRLLSRLPLFWRYFILLAAMVILFLSAFSIGSRLFTRALQDSYLDQAQQSFTQNCQSFSRALSSISSLPSAMENNSSSYLKASGSASPVPTDAIYSFIDLRDSLALQCAAADLPGDCFLFFGRSGVCLTRSQVIFDGAQLFSSHLIYEDGGQAVRSAMSQSFRGLQLLPTQGVSVKKGADPVPCLTVLVSSSNGHDTYGFLYSEQTISEYFHLNALPENTYLQLLRSDGSPLFSRGQIPDQTRGFIQLTAPIPELSCSAVIGIPQSFFHSTMQQVRIVPLLIFFLCIVLGIAMCFLFSHISVQPFRRLIHEHAMADGSTASDDEIATIDSFLRTAQQRAAALHTMLLSSLLVRSYSGQSIREDEYQSLSVAFPQFQQPQRSAIVRDRLSSNAGAEGALINLLRDNLPEPFLCEYINMDETLVIFPAEPVNFDLLQDTLLQLNQTDDGLPRLICGVSTPFIGLGELAGSIRQAQFCVSEDSRRLIIQFSEETVGTDLSSQTTGFDLKRFQQALTAWNQRELLSMLEAASAQPGPHLEELFYSIVFLLRDAAQAGNMSFHDSRKCTYLATATPAANLQQLIDVVNDLFRQKSALQLSDKQQLCEEMVHYIKTHFSDSSLCLFSIASQAGVSERFAHNAIQSITGMNFSTFLSHCRMQEAARLLRDTDLGIAEVAAQCGYPAISTFYRNFKKHYQMTPADYKDNAL